MQTRTPQNSPSGCEVIMVCYHAWNEGMMVKTLIKTYRRGIWKNWSIAGIETSTIADWFLGPYL